MMDAFDAVEHLRALRGQLSGIPARQDEALVLAVETLGRLIDLYEFTEIDPETNEPFDDPDDGPSCADQAERVYELLSMIGLEVS